MADAYYVLSDTERRREYDSLYGSRSEKTADPGASTDFFSTFANMFGSAAGGTTGAAEGETGQRPDANNVFGDVFEDVSHLYDHPIVESPCSIHDMIHSFSVLRLSARRHGGHGWGQPAVPAWALS